MSGSTPNERTPLLEKPPAVRRCWPSVRLSAALVSLPLVCLAFATVRTAVRGTPAGLAVEQPRDRPANLAPFPFERPFSCTLDHSHDPAGRYRVTSHNASCATPDPTLPPERPPALVPITHVHNGSFIDADGRERLLRGMNVAFKQKPFLPMTDAYHPSLSFSRADMRLLSSLGMNVIRLAVPWSAVQPTRHGFDEAYLERVLSIVRQCAEEGLYVIISAHQDLYAESFCGNGMPDWTITRDASTGAFPWPVRGFRTARYNVSGAGGFPVDDICNFGEAAGQNDWAWFYLSSAVTRAFWGLYTNDRQMRDHFVRYWAKLASVLRLEDNVVGYEILNEPPVAARSWLRALWAFSQQRHYDSTERDHLQPLYDEVHRSIRAVADRKLLFFEPVTGNAGGEGFKPRSTGILGDSKSALASHVYFGNFVSSHKTFAQQIADRDRQAASLGVGSIITEFDAEYGRLGRGIRALDRYLRAADGKSWIGWQYKEMLRGSPPTGSLIDPISGFLRRDMAALMSRPYAEAVHGETLVHTFDTTSHTFHLSFMPRSHPGQTVVRLSDSRWSSPSGFAVQVDPPTRLAMDGSRLVLFTTGVQGQVDLLLVPF